MEECLGVGIPVPEHNLEVIMTGDGHPIRVICDCGRSWELVEV